MLGIIWGVGMVWRQITTEGTCRELLTVELRDFPGSPVVKNVSCNAGDLLHGGETKILHAVKQQSLVMAAREFIHALQPKMPHATTETQCSQLKIFYNLSES